MTRIVCIGDSFLDQPHQVPMPARLQKRLNSDGDAFEVINMSRGGIDPDLYYVLFRELALGFHPDAIVVFIYEGNDFRRMENASPDRFDSIQGLFRRYPVSSIYGTLFPRTTVAFSDIRDGSMIFRWTDVSNVDRYTLHPHRSLEEVSEFAAKTYHEDSDGIIAILQQSLTEAEIDELTTYPVRLDTLAYMLSVRAGGPEDGIARVERNYPEVLDTAIAEKQVETVFEYLRRMNEECELKGIKFFAVLNPSWLIDPLCFDLYRRLGTTNDPLFAKTRPAQLESLSSMLTEANIATIDLRIPFYDEPGTHLLFDTHWSEKGADVAAGYVAKCVLDSGGLGE